MSGPANDPVEPAVLTALVRLPDLGSARLRRLLPVFGVAGLWERLRRGDTGSVRAIAEAAEVRPASAMRWAQSAHQVDLDAVARRLRQAGIDVVRLGDGRFPAKVGDDRDGPAVLFVRGDLAAATGPLVAVVGTRRATHYGREVAAELATGLARAGVQVVSGLAIGVDGAAHEAALVHGGRPVGVVGSGLDVVYPRRHLRLWHDVAAHGVLLSEFAPGARPEAWCFPVRNRTIAALADVVVVVESHAAGGSLLTADLAKALNRPLLVVPGSVRSPASAGANALLREPGVLPCCDVQDVLAALSLATAGSGRAVERRPAPSAAGDAVLRGLGWDVLTVDRVVERSGLTPPAVALELSRLERDGWVAREAGRWHRLAEAPVGAAALGGAGRGGAT